MQSSADSSASTQPPDFIVESGSQAVLPTIIHPVHWSCPNDPVVTFAASAEPQKQIVAPLGSQVVDNGAGQPLSQPYVTQQQGLAPYATTVDTAASVLVALQHAVSRHPEAQVGVSGRPIGARSSCIPVCSPDLVRHPFVPDGGISTRMQGEMQVDAATSSSLPKASEIGGVALTAPKTVKKLGVQVNEQAISLRKCQAENRKRNRRERGEQVRGNKRKCGPCQSSKGGSRGQAKLKPSIPEHKHADKQVEDKRNCGGLKDPKKGSAPQAELKPSRLEHSRKIEEKSQLNGLTQGDTAISMEKVSREDQRTEIIPDIGENGERLPGQKPDAKRTGTARIEARRSEKKKIESHMRRRRSERKKLKAKERKSGTNTQSGRAKKDSKSRFKKSTATIVKESSTLEALDSKETRKVDKQGGISTTSAELEARSFTEQIKAIELLVRFSFTMQFQLIRTSWPP